MAILAFFGKFFKLNDSFIERIKGTRFEQQPSSDGSISEKSQSPQTDNKKPDNEASNEAQQTQPTPKTVDIILPDNHKEIVEDILKDESTIAKNNDHLNDDDWISEFTDGAGLK